MSLFRNGSTALYRHLRVIGKGLPEKIFEATKDLDFDMVKAAKKLTIPVAGNTMIFDDETESNALMDFYLHEFRKGGRRMIDCCDPDAMGLSADERDLLKGHREARTSLYEITGTDAKNAYVHLRNVLSPEEGDVALSDIAMSRNGAAEGLLFFVRVIVCQGISMSSGLFFAFAKERREVLLADYAGRMKTVTPSEVAERRFVFFFQKAREFGEAQEFEDIEESKNP